MNNNSGFNNERSSDKPPQKNSRRKSNKRTPTIKIVSNEDVQNQTTEISQNTEDRPSTSSSVKRPQKSVLKCSSNRTYAKRPLDATLPKQPSSSTLKSRTDVYNFKIDAQSCNSVQSSYKSIKHQNEVVSFSDARNSVQPLSESLKNQNEVISFSDTAQSRRSVQPSSTTLKSQNEVVSFSNAAQSKNLVRLSSAQLKKLTEVGAQGGASTSNQSSSKICTNVSNAKEDRTSIKNAIKGRSFEPGQTYAVQLEDGRYCLLKVRNPDSQQQVHDKTTSKTKSGSADGLSILRTGGAASLNDSSIFKTGCAASRNGSSIVKTEGAASLNGSSIIKTGCAASRNGSSIINAGNAVSRNVSSIIETGGEEYRNGYSIINAENAASRNVPSIIETGEAEYRNGYSIINAGNAVSRNVAPIIETGGADYRNGSSIINAGNAASYNASSITYNRKPPSYEEYRASCLKNSGGLASVNSTSIIKTASLTSDRDFSTRSFQDSFVGAVDQRSILHRRLLMPDSRAWNILAQSSKDDEDWAIPDSDEELEDGNNWEPLPDQIKEMYAILESGKTLDLEWENPGRRPPSTKSNHSDTNDQGIVSDETNTRVPEPNEFDFQDEFSISDHPSKMANRKKGQVTQKRVARLDKVMFDIKRHTKLEKLQQNIVSSQSPQQPSPAPTTAEESSETS